MSGTLQASIVKDSASATSNLTLDASGNVTVGNNLTVTGSTTVSATSIGNLTYTGTLTGSTGILNIGSGQIYKDASGNVGIGTSSPARKLEVQAYGTAPQNGAMRISGLSSGAATTNTAYLEYTITGGGGGSVTQYQTARYNSGYEFATYFQDQAVWRDNTTNTERMRIDSSGNVGIGVAPSTVRLYAFASSNNVVGRVESGLTSGTTTDIFQVLSQQAAGTGYYLIRAYAGASPTVQFAVRGDGTVYAQNTTIQSLSDERLKENITDAADGLDVILGLKTRRFDWKEGYGNNRKNQLGFIAQEVEAVFPEAVDVWEEGESERTEYKSVGPSALIPVLVKAIQELSAKNDALEARLVALEAKQ